jgi:long-chain acyl-CoA synthetase
VDCLISHVLDLHKGDQNEVILLHLPLAHIITRNILVPAAVFTGNLLVLAEREKEKLLSNFKETSPTIFVTVPYVLDKFALAIKDRITLSPYLRRKLVRWILRKTRAAALEGLQNRRFEGYAYGLLLRFFDRSILKKVRDVFGGRLSKIAIGGSNSNREHVEFFWGIGIPTYEAYGATEMTNVACFTAPDGIKLGTVGKPVPGIEVRLEADGEILVRGPNVMKGYWNRPEATAQTIDAEGWYHTGDLGLIDDQGYLKIIDRKKDIFVLATGKNVAPQLVENTIKKSQLIAQVCCVGDGRNYLTALIYPDWTAVQAHLNLIHALQGSSAGDPRNDENVGKLIYEEIVQATAELSDYEKIKKFSVIPEPFSLENGLLTPTLKIRRKNIMKHYSEAIEKMYRAPPTKPPTFDK